MSLQTFEDDGGWVSLRLEVLVVVEAGDEADLGGVAVVVVGVVGRDLVDVVGLEHERCGGGGVQVVGLVQVELAS